jgi:hypothetical protein
MSKDTKNKKLLLGSALAGLMVAAPGLSVTTGKFFQTAKLEAGYGLAQAAEGSGTQGTTTAGSGTQIDDTTTQGDPATRGKKVNVEETQPSQPSTEKSGAKSCSPGKCGAGSCGGGK